MTNLKSYTTGFISSVLLTVAAFVPVYIHSTSEQPLFSAPILILYILVLAVIQLAVQIILFLHLNREQKPRLNLVTFITTMLLVLLLVVASLWIMSRLDSYHMTPQEIQEYLHESQGY